MRQLPTARRTCAALLLLAALSPAQESKADREASDAFFRSGQIPRLVVLLDEASCASLRAEPRKFTTARLRENERTVYEGVMVKLKGAAGSFREFDDWPSLTLRLDKVDAAQRFHGLSKLHLNKSPQDDTYLHEFLGSEIYRAAGLLAPRVTHARVWINDRDMGLYVVKEGFDVALLERGFKDSAGNLYDGGFCQDIDSDLEKDEGGDPEDRADLHALLACCQEPDLTHRWEALPRLVELDTFITYMALELMLGHWDGYCQNRNNYRLYFDPTAARAFFLPHGMDQILGDPGASILDNPPAILASAVMKNPAWRAAYRKRVGELLPLFDARRLKKRVDEVAGRLAPVLKAWDKAQAQAHAAAVDGLKSRLTERERQLKAQRSQPDPRPLVFAANKPVKLTGWRPNSECEDATLADEEDDGTQLLRITTGPSGVCIASWRRGVLLAQGRYRFHAVMRVKDVAQLADDPAAVGAGAGAGLRLSARPRDNQLLATADWTPIDFDFEVAESQSDVELVIELRAAAGLMEVRTDSLWLARLEKR